MTVFAEPVETREVADGWAFEPPRQKNRVIVRHTAAFAGAWPRDVHLVYLRGSGGGATGAQTQSATKGSGGGGGPQTCFGPFAVLPNTPYSGTVGAGGVANSYPGNGGGNVNGNPGSNSTFLSQYRPPVTLLGANAGLANGTGGAAAGVATFVSLTGLTMVQGAAGGSGQTSDVGLPGGDVDIVKGGLGGNTSGGGGAGAGFYSPGSAGGNNATAASATPIANSGGSTGGGGADATTVGQYGSPAAADGFWEFEYWTEEEES